MGKEKRNVVSCIGCGANVSETADPYTWYHNAASPGCWAVYMDLMAKEFGEYAYPEIHRLTVDSYAVQHPGDPTPQTIQSVNVHLAGLYLYLEKGVENRFISKVMSRMVDRFKGEFSWLEPPSNRGDVTVLDVVAVQNFQEHEEVVLKWVRSAWGAWREFHPVAKNWVERIGIT